MSFTMSMQVVQLIVDGMLKSSLRITGHDSEYEKIVDRKFLRNVMDKLGGR